MLYRAGSREGDSESSWGAFPEETSENAGQRNLWVGKEPEDKDSLGQVRWTGAGKQIATRLTDTAGLASEAHWLCSM